MSFMDLSGKWTCRERFDGQAFYLPGSQCDNKIGAPLEKAPQKITQENIRCLKEAYSFRGQLAIVREILIPEDWADKPLVFSAQRVNMSSRLFLDGKEVSKEIVTLSVPHRHTFTASAGKHELMLKLDNRNLINSDFMASGYSRDTQGYWCGAAGEIGIRKYEKIYIKGQRVFAEDGRVRLYVTVCTDCCKPSERRAIEIIVNCFGEHRFNVTAGNRCEVFKLEFEIGRQERWNEFSPVLHTLETSLYFEGCLIDKKQTRFGIRSIKSENGCILVNGRRIFLRGTNDCALFPDTGYPPTDIESWKREFSIAKEYGLNNIRFHAWCPPEEAFCAADELGMYISCELPIWLNKDVCALDLGSDERHRQFMYAEGMRIIKEYGNHPSFIMMSCGNELLGDFELLYELISAFKAFDSRRLYTFTTNFDHTPNDNEDYICAYKRSGIPVRLHAKLNGAWESTFTDYSDAEYDEIPVVSFEVGQHCQYPDFSTLDKFDKNLRAQNFEVIKNDLEKKGFLTRAQEYKKASGALALMMYKEEIEAALRTEKMSGFQLLSLSDYTGQCTAVVGMLDVFFESKGLVTPKQWRNFCSERVVLMRSERFFEPGGRFIAELSVFDYSRTPHEDEYLLEFFVDGKCVKRHQSIDGHVDIPLDFAGKNVKMTVRAASGESENFYDVWVLEQAEECSIEFTSVAKLGEKIRHGEDAVINICELKNKKHGGFYPPFWSPAFFKTDEPNGLIINNEHPSLSEFPCGRYSEFIWYQPTAQASVLDITMLGSGIRPIVECVPNLYDNTPSAMLFEVRAGRSNILFCGFDFDNRHKSTVLLKRSLDKYIKSGIKADYEITLEQMSELIGGEL